MTGFLTILQNADYSTPDRTIAHFFRGRCKVRWALGHERLLIIW